MINYLLHTLFIFNICFNYVYSIDVDTMNLACQLNSACRESSFGDTLIIVCILGFFFTCCQLIIGSKNYDDNYKRSYGRKYY
jgi:hypothetical protein